jgi:hypothetical protein
VSISPSPGRGAALREDPRRWRWVLLRERIRVVGIVVLAIVAVAVFSLFWVTRPSGRDILAGGAVPRSLSSCSHCS